MKTATLADKIAGILNAAPVSFDPEEEAVDATQAQVVSEALADDPTEEEILSKFRKDNIDLLAEIDTKYAGKKTSRRDLHDSDDESISETADSGQEVDEESIESADSNEDDDESIGDEEEGDDSIGDGEEGDDSTGDEIDEEHSEGDGESSFKHISDTNVAKQITKGLCVRNQMAMWENLLEIRIQLQKCLLVANKMPQKEKFHEIKQSSSDFTNKLTETKSSLNGTLDKLLLLQKLLLKQFPETKNLGKEETQVGEANDEEIPSDTENEASASETEEIQIPAKKRKLEDYEREIGEQFAKYKTYRNSTIQKWNDKTRLIVKGGATSHSIIDQIEYNLSNREKLRQRTQLKRSQYEIVGGENEEKVGEEYNVEIFDDDDFYHQLLRELIEVKSADLTDPVQLGRQWIQLQNLRSKMKRKIDTRATKGRKIRYAIHNKLVNFMAPIDVNSWTEEAKKELYNSLFGKNQPVFAV